MNVGVAKRTTFWTKQDKYVFPIQQAFAVAFWAIVLNAMVPL